MRSFDIKVNCPVCNKEVSRDGLKTHIAIVASLERKSNLQKELKHYNYKQNEEKN